MPQLSLYLDEDSMRLLRERAGEEGVSLSRYAGAAIEERVASSGWPEGYWGLYGSIDDESFSVPDDLDFSLDRPRPAIG